MEVKLDDTQVELSEMLQAGVEQVSMGELDARLQALGYERRPDSRATGVFRNLTAGRSFNGATWGVREMDTKQSAYHYQSRRDAKFKALQQLRQDVCVVVRGTIVTI